MEEAKLSSTNKLLGDLQRKLSLISSTSNQSNSSSVIINHDMSNTTTKKNINAQVLQYMKQDDFNLQDIYHDRMVQNGKRSKTEEEGNGTLEVISIEDETSTSFNDTDSLESLEYYDEEDEMLIPPSPPRSPPTELDPDKLYGLYDFSGPDPSHLQIERNEPVYLINDQDNYWWLIRKLTKQEKISKKQKLLQIAQSKNEFLSDIESITSMSDDGKIGFVPAECLETYDERLARYNCFKNEEIERFHKNPFDFDVNETIHFQNLQQSTPLPKIKNKNKIKKNVSFNHVNMFETDNYVDENDEIDDENDDDDNDDDLNDLSMIRQQQLRGMSHDINHNDINDNSNHSINTFDLKQEIDKTSEVLSEIYPDRIPLIVKKSNQRSKANNPTITINQSPDYIKTPIKLDSDVLSSNSSTKSLPSPSPSISNTLNSLSKTFEINKNSPKLSPKLSPTYELSESSTHELFRENLDSKNNSHYISQTNSQNNSRDNSQDIMVKDSKSVEKSSDKPFASISNGLRNSLAKINDKREKRNSLTSKIMSATQGDLKHSNSLSKDYKDKLDNTNKKSPRKNMNSSSLNKRIVNKENGKIKNGEEEYPKFYKPTMSKAQNNTPADDSSIGSFSPDTPPLKNPGRFDTSPEAKKPEISNNLTQLRRSVILDRLTKMTSDIQEQLDDYDHPERNNSNYSPQNQTNLNDSIISESTIKSENSQKSDLETKRERLDQMKQTRRELKEMKLERNGSKRSSRSESRKRESIDGSYSILSKSTGNEVGLVSNRSTEMRSNGSVDNSRGSIDVSTADLSKSSIDHNFNPRPNGKRASFLRNDTMTSTSSSKINDSYNSQNKDSSFINNSLILNNNTSMHSQRSNRYPFNDKNINSNSNEDDDDELDDDLLPNQGEYTPLTSMNSLPHNTPTNKTPPSFDSLAEKRKSKAVHEMFLPILGKFDELAEKLAELDGLL